jgi:hypothetical protein
MDTSPENREQVSQAHLPRGGGGFGGLYAVRGLTRAPFTLTVMALAEDFRHIGQIPRILITNPDNVFGLSFRPRRAEGGFDIRRVVLRMVILGQENQASSESIIRRTVQASYIPSAFSFR